MKKRFIVSIIGGVVAIGLVVAIVYLIGDRDKSPGQQAGTGGESELPYLDPAKIKNREMLEQVRRLWPDVLKKDTRDPEKVKAEWKAFAAKYPDNFYLPPQFKKKLTEEEQKKVRWRMEAHNSVVTRMANLKAQARNARGDVELDITKNLSPEEQEKFHEINKAYYAYKIHELESRIQLLDFASEKSGLDADQISRSKKERAEWQAELKQLKEREAALKKEKA